MPLGVLSFLGFLILCLAYSYLRGGTAEKAGATIAWVATAATFAVQSGVATLYLRIEWGVVTVDLLTLLAFIWLALSTDRYWTMWVAALQLLIVAFHAGRVVKPEMMPWAYAILLFLWSWLVLVLILIGTWRHQARIRKWGADPSWNDSLHQ
ncbi:hypothetical protein GCM10023219_20710 [Stakelama sediminis]|uniref:Uncharacterized protein n=1 Tax=Stakelama sediminis TaxID=463200 RepID=A0A840Z2B6_9SPHN|nr:hypothetical protein [Stakelama sediminis]MBB5719939.1 hypothetical protein [Stakelama sediminis]